MRHVIRESVEPELRHSSEQLALAGDGRGHHHVVGADPIRGDQEQFVAQIVHITHLSAADGQIRQMGLNDGRRLNGGHNALLVGRNPKPRPAARHRDRAAPGVRLIPHHRAADQSERRSGIGAGTAGAMREVGGVAEGRVWMYTAAEVALGFGRRSVP